MSLPANVEEVVLRGTGADSIVRATEIQSLWSGYGSILRVELATAASGRTPRSVIVKWVAPPNSQTDDHPRGWNTNCSHRRKIRSYQVESNWYRRWSRRCDDLIRVPEVFAVETLIGQHIFVLEDLDASGFDQRRGRLDAGGILLGLQWLARFHANFLGQPPTGLWPIGTYWHLATRQEELEAMVPGPLREAAPAIDQTLNRCRYQTIVHGDAKVANFCFRPDGALVPLLATVAPKVPLAPNAPLAAVDFQYVGGGCGMKDVAYFLSSCVSESECERNGATYLDEYFMTLRHALSSLESKVDIDDLEQEWRALYPYAWADFTRFLLGWCPGHQKLNEYSQRMTDDVLRHLGASGH